MQQDSEHKYLPDPQAGVSEAPIDEIRRLIHPDVIELEGGDKKVTSVEERVQVEEKLLQERRKRPHSFYRDLIFSLIGVRLDEQKARTDWKYILEHKYFMSEKLTRNVGIRVAALDFYTNIKRGLQRTMVIDPETLTDAVEQSVTDGLTGTHNRRYFDMVIARLFQQSKISATPFSLLLLDIDHFKVYNDLNGHVSGDLVLVELVRILHAVSRKDDIVARYGGEEFAVVFPNTELATAVHVSEAIAQAVNDYRFPNEGKLPGHNLTISGGVATFKNQTDVTELIHEADTALYQAKREGRSRIIVYEEIA